MAGHHARPAAVAFVCKDALAGLVRLAQGGPAVPAELVAALGEIAAGVHARMRPPIELDDYRQEAVLFLLGNPLRACDPAQHCFNFFVKCLQRRTLNWTRDQRQRDRRAADYRDAYARAHTPRLSLRRSPGQAAKLGTPPGEVGTHPYEAN